MNLHAKSSARRSFAAAVLAVAFVSGPAVAESVTLTVAYAYPSNFQKIKTEIAERFMAAHPDIEVELEAPAKDYEELVQRTLRASVTDQELPAVAFHGMHRVRLLSERDQIVSLTPFIEAEADWNSLGYPASMLTLTEARGETFGMPFSISLPIVYYNADLVGRAGGDIDELPTTWEELLALSKKIEALDDKTMGVHFFYYSAANNWTFHALVQSFGGRMMTPDEQRLAFTGAEGLEALRTLRKIGQAGMADLGDRQAFQAFSAGTLGILVASSSRITRLTNAIGDRFPMRTAPLPMPVADGKLPAGGSAAMMHTRDPKTQQAAWAFIKFATGPVGQTIMVKNSGYMPGNTIPVTEKELLGGFYDQNPNHMTPVSQIERATRFFTFPGENSLKIPVVVRDHLQNVVTLKREPEAVLADMESDVQALLPE